jgi:hypothetical protein
MDSQGRIFVADCGNSRVQIFDANGKFPAEWRTTILARNEGRDLRLRRPKGSASTMRQCLWRLDRQDGGTALD